MSAQQSHSGAIRHIVMWRVKGENEIEKQAAISRVKHKFESLRGRIPGMTRIEIGVDSSGVSYACDVVLVSEFETQSALVAYATHPEHLKVRDALEGVRIERYQVDYAVNPDGGV